MPPKKEADSKKKKGATAGGSADLTPEDQIKLLKVTIDSLQVQLADRSEETSRAIHAKDDVVDKMKGLSKALDEERQSKLDLLESMTRDMKESELEFLSQLKIKEADISKANEILLEQERQFKDDLNVKETTIAKKDIEIRVLNETIMKQRNEFNATLKVRPIFSPFMIHFTSNILY